MSAALAIVLTKPTTSATAAAASTPDRFVATVLSPSYRYDGTRSVTAAESRSRRVRPRPRLRSLSHTNALLQCTSSVVGTWKLSREVCFHEESRRTSVHPEFASP